MAENIKLLLIGPLLVGLTALAVAFGLPQTYESKAVIKSGVEVPVSGGGVVFSGVRPELLVAMAHTSAVLEPVRQRLGFMVDASSERAVGALRDTVQASVGRADKLITITVSAPSAKEAQGNHQALLDELFKQSQPSGADRSRLEARLQFEKEALANTLKLETELQAFIKSGKESDLVSATYAKLATSKGLHFQAIQDLERQLTGLTVSALVQPATLPDRPTKPKKALVAVVTTLASGFVLLVFVFVRQALRNAGANPESAAKIARIKQAFR